MTDWILKILGFAGGGWGSAVAILVLIGAGIYFVNLWRKAKQDKADKDTKDKLVDDHAKLIGKQDQQGKQIKSDDHANEDAINAGRRPSP